MLAIKLLGAASGYILAWWVTHHEGAAAYGRFELALTVLAIGALGARLGLDGVMVKWLASAQVQGFAKIQRVVVARAVLMTILSGFACCALVFWASNALTTWSGDENTRDMWPWVAVGIPLMALWGLSAEMLRGLSKMRSYALSQQGVLTAVAVGVLWVCSFNVVEAYAWAVGVVTVMSMGMLLAALPNRALEDVSAEDGDWSWRAMISTSWPMLMGSAMYLVMSWSDTLLVSHFLEEDQVGVYRLTFKLAAVVTLVQAAVNSYAAPLFSQRHAVGDRDGLKQALRQSTLLNVAFSVPAFAGILIVGPTVLKWFGPEFMEGYSCLVWLAVGQLSMTLCGPVLYLLNMTGFERTTNRILWSTAAINVAMNAWAIPRYGIVGAAVTTAVSLALWNGASAWAVHKKLGLNVWLDLIRWRD